MWVPLTNARVRLWPNCEVFASVREVRSAGYSGPDLLAVSSFPFDPERTFHAHELLRSDAFSASVFSDSLFRVRADSKEADA